MEPEEAFLWHLVSKRIDRGNWFMIWIVWPSPFVFIHLKLLQLQIVQRLNLEVNKLFDDTLSFKLIRIIVHGHLDYREWAFTQVGKITDLLLKIILSQAIERYVLDQYLVFQFEWVEYWSELSEVVADLLLVKMLMLKLNSILLDVRIEFAQETQFGLWVFNLQIGVLVSRVVSIFTAFWDDLVPRLHFDLIVEFLSIWSIFISWLNLWFLLNLIWLLFL